MVLETLVHFSRRFAYAKAETALFHGLARGDALATGKETATNPTRQICRILGRRRKTGKGCG
jgi:hypothetical protein